MAKRDYYEVLGVERDVAAADLKKAYRKLAMQFHPDRNPDDSEAEENFKEVSEAFQVLSDDRKRPIYDQYGHAGLEGGGAGGMPDVGDIFSQFNDIFGDIFGGGRSRRRSGPARGRDLEVVLSLELRDAVFGAKEEVKARYNEACEDCSGTGAKDGALSTCRDCGGTGKVARRSAVFIVETACPSCRGRGSMATEACGGCRGSGQAEVSRNIKVTIPKGIGHGDTLRVPGQGAAGRQGGPRGDLFVTVQVEEDPDYVRDGLDLIHRLRVPYTTAALGGELEVTTLAGEQKSVKIPAGTQPGHRIRIRGEGVPDVRGRGHGDLTAVVGIDVPRKLSRKAKKLLKDLETELGEQR